MIATSHSPRRISGIGVGALFLLLAGAGCAANSQMTNQWRDPSLAPGSLHSVMVVGIRKDPVRRRIWEDAFTKALTARGVAATPSYKEFPDAAPDTQQVIQSVSQNHYDAVLTSVRLPDEPTTKYVPGALRQERVARPGYYGSFHSYWVTVQDPGYTETDTIIRVQTDVWAANAERGQLVWSGTLATLESVTGRSVEQAVTQEIMPEMEKQGVFPAVAK